MAKITLIGAGSVGFARKLVCDILQRPALAGSTIALMDIDADRLKVAKIQMNKIVKQLNVPARIEAHTNQRQALRGADYAICTVQVGGFDATVTDFKIPKKYGVLQTIADTLGIGGIFRTLRTAPVIMSIARDLADVGAPDALFLNYTNPMSMLIWSAYRTTGVPVVGLCHSVQGTSQRMARFAGLPYEDCTFKSFGINHNAYFTEFRYKGRDAYPLLFKAMENPEIFTLDPVRFEMMRRLGYFVTESSEHQSEYNPHFIHFGKDMIKKFGIPIDEYIRRSVNSNKRWKTTRRELLDQNRPATITPISQEYASAIINAHQTGEETVIAGNVENTGLITNLPTGCCVEVPVRIDQLGFHPEYVGALPPQLAAYIRTNVNVQELTVEAAITKKREHVYHAAMLDPHLQASIPLDKIWKLCDELLDAHEKFLPAYEPTAPDTGRTAKGLTDVPIARLESRETPFARDAKATRFIVSLENPSSKKISLPIKVIVQEKGYRVSGLPKRLEVAKGKTKSFAFTLHKTAKAETGFKLELDVPLGCVPAGPYAEKIRSRLEIPTSSSRLQLNGKAPATAQVRTFELQADGFPAASGRIKFGGESLYLHLDISDTDLTRKTQRPWEGSCIELYSAQTSIGDLSASRPKKLFILPRPGKKDLEVLTRVPKTEARTNYRRLTKPVEYRLAPVPGIKSRLVPSTKGYTAELIIPIKHLAVDLKRPFLFELRILLQALGTEHGRSEATWAGAPSPNQSPDGYHMLVPLKDKK